MRQPIVLWVALSRHGRDVTGLLISLRMQNQPVQCFDRPAALDESGRQKVEQRGMGRTGAAGTEVVLGPHQSVTEMMLPDAIDDHTGRKGTGIRAGDPRGQFAPAASLLIGRQPLAAEDFEKSTRDFGAQAGRLARN